MKAYKIKVANEAESKEAQELLFALGYGWGEKKEQMLCILPIKFLFATFNGGLARSNAQHGFAFEDYDSQEITLPQLRDLVVLHRNDVGDATHIGSTGGKFYRGFKDYFFNGSSWVESDLGDISKIFLDPITQQPQMTWQDALRAVADGKEVEFYQEVEKKWYKITHLAIDEIIGAKCDFRVAPKTVHLEKDDYTKEELLKIAGEMG